MKQKKITHLMLSSHYKDNTGYQEYLLTKFHKKLGFDVSLISFQNDYDTHPLTYTNNIGVKIILLGIHKRSKIHFIEVIQNIFCKRAINVIETLEKESPDIIFAHGCQSIDNLSILKYKHRHPHTKIFIDQHGDYNIMPIKRLSQIVFQRIVCRYIANQLYKICDKYWGVTPWRIQYLEEVYHLPKTKLGLLLMGGDDTKIDFQHRTEIRQSIREKYGITDSNILITTGGRIEPGKNIHLLIKAINNNNNPKIKLLIFGKPTPDFEKPFYNLITDSNKVIYIGWINSDEVYNYFFASDLVVFPGAHSVLWEQAVASGVPCAFKYWEGMNHVDIGGNCIFIKDISPESINHSLNKILSNNHLTKMKQIASTADRKEFFYSYIAKKSIGLI